MNNLAPIHIKHIGDSLDRPLPPGIRPSRGSLTVNCLIPVSGPSGTELVYHNFDPKNWNQWYPPFTFYHTDLPKDDLPTPRVLIDFFESKSGVSSLFSKERLLSELREHCCAVLGLNDCRLLATPVVDRDYWIKFSQSKNIWALYCFSFYLMSAMQPSNRAHLLSRPDIGIIRIGESSQSGILIVENTTELLRDPNIREQIERYAIRLD